MPITRPVPVDQRAAGVAGVDRRVGLDRARDLEAGQRLDRAVDRGDRRRRTATGCSPNGEPIAATGSPTSTLALSPSGSGRSFSPPGSIWSSAMSAFGSSPTIFGGDLVAVGELDEDLARPLARVALAGGHDVRVGGDLALAVEHEAGADAAAAAAAAERGVEAALAEERDDGHHAGRLALVDRLRVEAALVAEALDDLDARGRGLVAAALRAWRRVVVAAAAAGEDERQQRDQQGRASSRGAPGRRSSSRASSARSACPACARRARARSPARGPRPAPARWR